MCLIKRTYTLHHPNGFAQPYSLQHIEWHFSANMGECLYIEGKLKFASKWVALQNRIEGHRITHWLTLCIVTWLFNVTIWQYIAKLEKIVQFEFKSWVIVIMCHHCSCRGVYLQGIKSIVHIWIWFSTKICWN